MGKQFNAHVAVHKDPAEVVWFAPGDDVPDWALELVGDHVYGDADEVEDVRLTDPENEEDDDATKWSTVNTLPPAAEAAPDLGDDSDYSELSKDELKELCEERDLPVSGNKAELIARLEEDDDSDDDAE